MNKFHFYILIFLLFWAESIHAQSIKGTVYDLYGDPVASAMVEIRNADDLILAFALSKKSGDFEINISELNPSANHFLIVRKINFVTHKQQVQLSEISSKFFEIQLEDTVTILQPLVVQGEIPPIKEKSDTVIYHVESFKDGSEKVIEDVLKNMPGIDVDEESGTIKYKGMPIEKVLLDGDDLFDRNYTTGTRNISADIVKDVEAIENWSENKLLKGIENSSKVALNLKLKKGKSDFSGNAHAEAGVENRINAGITGILLSSKNKIFGLTSFNNTGVNNSPSDYYSAILSKAENERNTFQPFRYIEEEAYLGRISTTRLKRNNLWYSSLNELYKLNDKMDFRLIFNFTQDFLSHYLQDTKKYQLPNEELVLYETEDFQKRPKLAQTNLDFNWQLSNNSSIQLKSEWLDESILSINQKNVNYTTDANYKLLSKNYFTSNRLFYTQKINQQQAWTMESGFSSGTIPQNLTLSPQINFEEHNFSTGNETHQVAKSQRDVLFFNTSYFGNLNSGNNFETNLAIIYSNESLESALSQKNSFNHSHQQILHSEFTGKYGFKWNKFEFTPEFTLKNYQINFEDNLQSIQNQFNNFVINPKISISKKFDADTQLTWMASMDQAPQSLNYLFSNFIISGNRVLKRNLPQFNFSETIMSGLQFKRAKPMQFHEYEFKLNYFRFKNAYFSNHEIFNNFSEITRFYLPETNTTLSAEATYEQFLSFMYSTARLIARYRISDYKNMVNNSDLRDVSSRNLMTRLFLKTGFKSAVNLQNIFTIHIANYLVDGKKGNYNTLYQNNFKFLVRPNKVWFSSISLDSYHQNNSKNTAVFFLDYNLRFNPAKTNYTLGIEARNLLNYKYYTTSLISDYYNFENRRSLNTRHILLTARINF
ncbi:MAG: hypothetical protein Q4G27_05900 [Flavobacteriaceae bacterium]|nr:hypothetical protein [Flavobacteriaceae bacterium]